MASHQLPSPPPPLAPTTISALTDDLLREIFLRLPDIPSLLRAASTCRPFLRAIRSSAAFRRRFRELHAPPILALFSEPYMRAFVPAARRMSGTFADLLRDDGASEWKSHSEIPYSDGYVFFVNRSTEQDVCYNVHSQALEIYPKKAHGGIDDAYLEFYTLPPDQEDQRPSRVVCVHHESSWAWARVAVFSSHTMEWQIFPESGTLLPESSNCSICTVADGFVCWLYQDCIIALNTANFQFSRVDLPPSLREPDSKSRFNIGRNKDGELCLVGVQECTLSIWLLTPDNDGIHRFMPHKTVPLHTSVKEVTKRSVEDIVDVEWQLIIVIDGFVYLSVFYCNDPQSWFLSLCLESAEVNFLFKKTRCSHCFDPYIMAWPPSLTHNKVSLLLCLKVLVKFLIYVWSLECMKVCCL
jgi:hypothetical protein